MGGLSYLLTGRKKAATPACTENSEGGSGLSTLGLITKARLVECRTRFDDKFGRDHELMWTTVENIETGQSHTALFNLKFWPDPHYLELAVGCQLAVEPDSNFLRGKGWDRQPEELKEAVIQRLEDPALIPDQTTPQDVAETLESDDYQVDYSTTPGHPCVPAMNEIIAAVGREAKSSGLVACGYVFVDPDIFFNGGVS
jgi:hypothetical protein